MALESVHAATCIEQLGKIHKNGIKGTSFSGEIIGDLETRLEDRHTIHYTFSSYNLTL